MATDDVESLETCAEYIRTGGRSGQLPFRSLTQEIPNGGIVVKLLALSQLKRDFRFISLPLCDVSSMSLT